jgi:hypothetical protein
VETSKLDIAYIVRFGDLNNELKYSLRTLKNLDFPGKVFIAGYKPKWVRNVTYLPVENQRDKFKNAYANFLELCRCDQISDDFIFMHDDYFIVKEVAHIPNYYKGSLDLILSRIKAKNRYIDNLAYTRDFLKEQGIKDPLCFDVHMPFIINRKKFLDLVDRYPEMAGLNKLSAYGNLYGLEGQLVRDVKVRGVNDGNLDRPFISSNDHLFRRNRAMKKLRKQFAKKSRFED